MGLLLFNFNKEVIFYNKERGIIMKTLKNTLLTVVVCLAVGLLLSAPATAKTTVTNGERSYLGVNPCTGVDMLYNFQVHTVNGLVDNDNRKHTIIITTEKIDAEDADGNIYSGKSSRIDRVNVSPDTGQGEGTFTEQVTLTSDTGPDVTITYEDRIVVNAKGEVVIAVAGSVEQECTP